jgi:hypothetical protein
LEHSAKKANQIAKGFAHTSKTPFLIDSVVEVDHIIPSSKN